MCTLVRIVPLATVLATAAVFADGASGWRTVVDDRFSKSGRPPRHWSLYDGPYGSGAHNCARPSHNFVSKGHLHLLMKYERRGDCGAGWYTGGMKLRPRFASIDQRITLRWRVAHRRIQGHRVIPMRWPDGSWPEAGEEDFCEGSSLRSCFTFLHYSTENRQIYRRYRVDLTRWHIWRFTRRNHVLRVFRDRLRDPIWVYRGSSTTLPDTLKRVVLQQECNLNGCPSGTRGREDIRIDWIRVEVPG
jgi:hypothetical protein